MKLTGYLAGGRVTSYQHHGAL